MGATERDPQSILEGAELSSPLLVAGTVVARQVRAATADSPRAIVYSIHLGAGIEKVTDRTGEVPLPMGSKVLWPVRVNPYAGRSGGVFYSLSRAGVSDALGDDPPRPAK